jgi:hypothetical protein
VNTYTIDNVRIRYSASNVKGYAQGLDFRLKRVCSGTLLFSFGYLKTEENSEEGYIARPTDQRLKFGLLFQDYMPNIPSVKIYLNLVYNTGLPEVLLPMQILICQNRLNDYRRCWFSKVLLDNAVGSQIG